MFVRIVIFFPGGLVRAFNRPLERERIPASLNQPAASGLAARGDERETGV
ncbi:MAG: hypothetical protein K6T66_02220 [Peptococcaceae bacterium]|nr:hypothetical protein [Peptococcaceae bacterium]